MILVIDGPEKAGKSTFTSIFAEQTGYTRRKYITEPIPESVAALGTDGKPTTLNGDFLHLAWLRQDFDQGGDFVWDRAWPSEAVYSKLMGRGRRLEQDPWLGEWLFGRAVQSHGLRVMLLGPNTDSLYRGRAANTGSPDLDCDPGVERALFHQYAFEWGWEPWENQFQLQYANVLSDLLVRKLEVLRGYQVPPPPYYAGPPDPRVVFVTDWRNPQNPWWLPFSTPSGTRLGKVLGNAAFRCGWTTVSNLEEVSPLLARAGLVVACGQLAQDRVAETVPGVRMYRAPLPTSLYGPSQSPSWRTRVEEALRTTVMEVVELGR